MPTLALCVICHDRPDELRHALASAPGFDEVVVVDMASDPPLDPVPDTRWLRCDENEGVAAGRNRQAEMASAEVLVFLDDDARFLDGDAAERIRRSFDARPRAGALAFLVQRPGGTIVASEQPFRGHTRDPHRGRPCAYFLGGAAAVRRAAFFEAGGFDARYQYSTEEVDLGFGLLAHGWELHYEPTIRVEHAPSSRGRSLNPQVPALRLRNRILLARRRLPVVVAVPHVTAWGARTFVEAVRARRLGPWLHAWRDGMTMPVTRQPLSLRDLRSAHAHGGRVLW